MSDCFCYCASSRDYMNVYQSGGDKTDIRGNGLFIATQQAVDDQSVLAVGTAGGWCLNWFTFEHCMLEWANMPP